MACGGDCAVQGGVRRKRGQRSGGPGGSAGHSRKLPAEDPSEGPPPSFLENATKLSLPFLFMPKESLRGHLRLAQGLDTSPNAGVMTNHVLF